MKNTWLKWDVIEAAQNSWVPADYTQFPHNNGNIGNFLFVDGHVSSITLQQANNTWTTTQFEVTH